VTQPKQNPPIDLLESLFIYDPDSGVVTRRIKINSIPAGAVVGILKKCGYLIVTIDKKEYQLHRIIWSLHYKEPIPQGMLIDHINRDRTDNRIFNLRLADYKLNSTNKVVPPRYNINKPGKGVSYDKRRKRWRVRLRDKDLGYHQTYAEAVACRNAALLAENLT